jgi:hypothetical protein
MPVLRGRCGLAAVLPLLPRRLQLPIPLGLILPGPDKRGGLNGSTQHLLKVLL